MAIIGYMEGTDPALLSKLVALGHETYPLGNGWDNHGKYIRHITQSDGIKLIIGYLHKFVPTQSPNLTPMDMLVHFKTFGIPIVVITPEDYVAKAKEILGAAADFSLIMTPQMAYERVPAML
jgi:hypothetical protein